jgi:hypothetical protein
MRMCTSITLRTPLPRASSMYVLYQVIHALVWFTDIWCVYTCQWIALAGAIVCFLLLALYCAYQGTPHTPPLQRLPPLYQHLPTQLFSVYLPVINPKLQAMLADKARKDAAVRNAFQALLKQAHSLAIVTSYEVPVHCTTSNWSIDMSAHTHTHTHTLVSGHCSTRRNRKRLLNLHPISLVLA